MSSIVTLILARKWLRDTACDEVEDLGRLEKPPAVVAELRKVAGWFTDMKTFDTEFPPAEEGAGEAAPPGAGEAAPPGSRRGRPSGCRP